MVLQPSLNGRKTILASHEISSIVRAKPVPKLSNAAMAAGRHLVPNVQTKVVAAYTSQMLVRTRPRQPLIHSLQPPMQYPLPTLRLHSSCSL